MRVLSVFVVLLSAAHAYIAVPLRGCPPESEVTFVSPFSQQFHTRQSCAQNRGRTALNAKRNAKIIEQDLYEVLGVDRNAEQKEIKTAYRKLASVYHPDVNPDPEAKEIFVQVSQAWETLGDEQKRRTYNYQMQSGLSDDFSERVTGFRKAAGPQYNAAADAVEKAFSDSRMLILIYSVPSIFVLGLLTFYPDVLHDMVRNAGPLRR
mmetsp:Transcript_36483/g.85734  ORF Transcript_36483/g.85734 Transcript_36483/m.85734 type:complete len:207 (+) Transcript_36483:65-685(+)|eukprot:2033708-Rhodomonas_salina.3